MPLLSEKSHPRDPDRCGACEFWQPANPDGNAGKCANPNSLHYGATRLGCSIACEAGTAKGD